MLHPVSPPRIIGPQPGPPGPSRIRRFGAAASIASVAATLAFLEPSTGEPATDFDQILFAAKALLHGANPYSLFGPGKIYNSDFRLVYPITSAIAILPLGLLSSVSATLIFVWVSTALLVYGATRDGWFRMPMFISSAFIYAARRGQWSPALTSAWFIPWMGWILAAKPNVGLAIFASASSLRMMKNAVIGALVLGGIGLILLPTWPSDWLAQISHARHVVAPVTQPGGFLVLFALLRWRRPEARLLVALACVPHTMFWYELLPLMVIPATFHESVAFALVSTTGLVFEQMLLAKGIQGLALIHDFNAIMIAVGYLPATAMVLRRSNSGTFNWSSAAPKRMIASRPFRSYV
jgi:hypothetical protein